MDYLGWARIPATSQRNRTNPDKIRTQPAKKYRKILSKSGPEGSPEPPESLRDPSGTRSSEENRTNQFSAATADVLTFARGGFASFWDLAGSPKSTKNDPGSEKVRAETAPEAVFVVFLAVALRSRSPDRFLESPTLENPII